MIVLFLVRVMSLAGGLRRIDVNGHRTEIFDLLQQLTLGLDRDLVPFGNGQFRVHGDIYFRVHPMAEPLDADLGHILDAWGLAGRFSYLFDDSGFDPAEQPGEDELCRIPNDLEDHYGDQ